MKGRNLMLMALITLAAGIAMIIFRHILASNSIVVGCGILFILSGIANITIFLAARDKDGHARMGALGTGIGWLASGAAVVLGVIMVLFRSVFETMVGYMFAVLILFGALFQFFLLLFGSRPVRLSGWFYLVPMALCGAAVYIFMQPAAQADLAVMTATGCAFAFFGLMTAVEGAAISAARRASAKAKTETAGKTEIESKVPKADTIHDTAADSGAAAQKDL